MYQRLDRMFVAFTLLSLNTLSATSTKADETIRTDDFSAWRQPATGWTTVGDVHLHGVNAKRLVASAGTGVVFRGDGTGLALTNKHRVSWHEQNARASRLKCDWVGQLFPAV